MTLRGPSEMTAEGRCFASHYYYYSSYSDIFKVLPPFCWTGIFSTFGVIG